MRPPRVPPAGRDYYIPYTLPVAKRRAKPLTDEEREVRARAVADLRATLAADGEDVRFLDIYR
jgi:hypothetical protein